MSEPSIAPEAPQPMAEDPPAAPATKRELSPPPAGDVSAAPDEPNAKKPKVEDANGDPRASPPSDPSADDPDASDDSKDIDVKTFAARLRPGTLKHTCFVLLQRAGVDGMTTDAILDSAVDEGLYAGKNRNVLTTTLSHEGWFVHNPDNKGAWCLRSFLEGEEATAAALAAQAGTDPAPAGGGAKRKAPEDGAASKKQPKAGPTAEEKAAAAAARAEKAAQQASAAAEKAASKIEAKIHAQLTKGNEDKLKKAAKALSAENGTLAKHATALEAAEAKARAAGISEEDVKKAIASATGGKKGGKGGKAKPPTPSVAVSAGKSAADILKEPGCPSDQLPPHALAYTGDQGDRHKLMAWKKEVERIKEKIERDRDAYVAKRRKQLRAEAAKEGQAAGKIIAEVCKHAEAVEKAKASVAKAAELVETLEEKSRLIQETLKAKAALAKQDVDGKNAAAMQELEKKLAKLGGGKMDDAMAMVEKERMKELAKVEREMQRKAEKAERDRVKEEEKAARAAAREALLAAQRKKKEEEILRKQREAKYPIDDDELAAEFAAEAAAKGVDVATLYKPLPAPTPVEDGPLVADEAALADFFKVFGEDLNAPKGLGTSKGLRAVIVGCGDALADVYKSLLAPAMEIEVLGKGRSATKWRRVLSESTWPEIVRRVLERKKVGSAGAEALATRPWQQLSVGEHVLALRGLADLALGGEKPRANIAKRLEDAAALRTARILEYNAEAARRRAVENKAKEKRKAIRAAAAAKRKAEKEEKRLAREAAMAAGEEVEDDADDDDDDEEDAEDDDDNAENADAREDDDDEEGPQMDDDADAKEEEKEPSPEKPKLVVKVKAAKKEPAEPKPPKEPSPEPTFELPKHLREYEGHPDDRKALMAWRAEHNRVAAQLELEKREYEKRKRSEARKEQERERMERARLEEEAEAKRLKAKQEEDRKEKEHRKREAKRMEEDAAVAVRTKSLGKDRHLRTYWWGVGSIKGAVYVEDAEGKWGVYTTRAEVDELMHALHHWGVREKALKQALHRRIHTIYAELRKRARDEEDAAENDARRAASGYPKRDRVNPEDVPRGPGGGPDVPADESGPLAAARRHMEAMCAQGEGASLARSDGTAGAPDGSGWRGFRARARGCAEKADIAAALLDLEAALYAVQVKEFMDPEEAAARRAAEEAGEAYESEPEEAEEEYYDDDDDEEFFGDFRDQETYESKLESGLIYPIWDTKFERNKWREAVVGKAPGAALAYAAAALEDAASPFLRALRLHPR